MERIPTGIPGLDELLEGGFPKKATILLSGGPGTGKTTFGMQFLVGGAKNGEVGGYISLEEDINRMIENLSRYNWGLPDLVKQQKIIMKRMDIYSFDTLKAQIENLVDRFAIERMVIDSITIIGLFFRDIFKLRRGILDLGSLLKRLNITTILISEVPLEDIERLSTFGVEEYAVDGVVKLYRIRRQDVFLRYLAIIKMRGTKHSERMHPIEMTEIGIKVYPYEQAIL